MKRFERMHMPTNVESRSALALGMVTALGLILALYTPASAAAPPDSSIGTTLDHGFLGLYNLDFTGAQKDFSAWEAEHPDDPVGPVSEAAGCLFSEFNRLGVLESQFYEMTQRLAHARNSARIPRCTTIFRLRSIAHNNWPGPA
jgi:hypothetical protein